MTEKSCCFTGHRFIPAGQIIEIKERLILEITALIDEGYEHFLVGGALGFDTLAARVLLFLRTKYSGIKVTLVQPCADQSKRWGQDDRALYEKIKVSADRVVCLAPSYTSGCMHVRNRYLVDNSSACICYMTKSTGGTAYTVNYARKNEKRVINVADEQ